MTTPSMPGARENRHMPDAATDGTAPGASIADRLDAAHADAQCAFRTMLIARCYSDPDDPRTKTYIAAERLVDSILVDAQWEKAKAELDRLQTADLEELAQGDHFRYERVDV